MVNLTQRERAEKVLLALFADEPRVSIAKAVEGGNALGISERTIRRVAHDMGVVTIQNGRASGFWERKAK